MFISGVAWRRAIREEGRATLLFWSDLIELWEIMWDLIKNKDSLDIVPMSSTSFRFVWVFVTVHISVVWAKYFTEFVCVCVRVFLFA
jgi:hypothetical protein